MPLVLKSLMRIIEAYANNQARAGDAHRQEEGTNMRILYVAVVLSVVLMIMLGSYLYMPVGAKTGMNREMIKNKGDEPAFVKRTDGFAELIKKYKLEIRQMLHSKKA